MKVKFIDFPSDYKKRRTEVRKAMDDVLTRGDLILRDDVAQFEKTFAKHIGTKYCIAVNSCTDALYLALRGLDIGPGDEVIVPSRTFVASVQVIVQLGATPVYYDVGSFSDKFITKKTKAIMPVHIEGEFDKQFEEILKASRKNNIPVVEDAAQALGATLNGKHKAGSFGVAGCFSFYPAKILGCYGDAGAITTNDKKMYEYCKEARNHFKYTNAGWGINSRMDNLQAAILLVKIKYHLADLDRREKIAGMYTRELKRLGDIELPPHTDGRVWQDYIVRTASKEERDRLFDHMAEWGVETMKNNYNFPVPKLPLAQAYEDETLRLPCNPEIKNKEVKYVIKKVKEFYK